jgi:hypothetical protein
MPTALSFGWLVVIFLWVQLARDVGLPLRVAQGLQVTLLLLMLLVLAGVF